MNLFVASLMGIVVVCEGIIVAFSFIFLLLYLLFIFTENFSLSPFVGCFQVNYLSFNPYNEWILATASSDTTIGLFDMRKLTVPLHVLSSHTYALYAPAPPLRTNQLYYHHLCSFMPLCVSLDLCTVKNSVTKFWISFYFSGSMFC